MKKLLVVSAILATTYFTKTFVYSSQQQALKNYEGNYTCASTEVYSPKSVEELQAIVKKARVENKKIMTGSEKFASQLDAACADKGAIQITLKNINKLIGINKEDMTVTTQAGIRFNELNILLDKEQLAINMVTELNLFTIGGMLGSGTHGSNLAKKSALIADYVTEMKIVDGYGDIRTLRGDDLDLARVNLGVLGIVVEVTIEVEKAFKVKATQVSSSTDSDLEDTILDLAENNFSASLAWFPGLAKYTATLYNKVPYETPGDAFNAQADAAGWKFFAYKMLNRFGHSSTFGSCVTARFRHMTRKRPFFKSLSTGKYIKKDAIGKSHQVQYFQCKQKGKKQVCAWDVFPIKLQEIGISYEDTLDAISDIRSIVDKKKYCFALNGVYFRFSNASNSALSMNSGRKTTFISIEYALNPNGKAPINYDVFQEIEQLLLNKYQGRPHFGKNSVPVFLGVKSKFPKFDQFLELKAELDPENMYTNNFWERIVNDELPDSVLNKIYQKDCVNKDTCYCQKDTHCPKGTSCQSGRFFEKAKICR